MCPIFPTLGSYVVKNFGLMNTIVFWFLLDQLPLNGEKGGVCQISPLSWIIKFIHFWYSKLNTITLGIRVISLSFLTDENEWKSEVRMWLYIGQEMSVSWKDEVAINRGFCTRRKTATNGIRMRGRGEMGQTVCNSVWKKINSMNYRNDERQLRYIDNNSSL